MIAQVDRQARHSRPAELIGTQESEREERSENLVDGKSSVTTVLRRDIRRVMTASEITHGGCGNSSAEIQVRRSGPSTSDGLPTAQANIVSISPIQMLDGPG